MGSKCVTRGDGLQRFLILFLLSLFLFSCSKSPTEPDGYTLSGTVKLEGETDHGGVTVEIYNIAEYDSLIQSYENRYSKISILPNHIYHSRNNTNIVSNTTTNDSGEFILNNIPSGNFILFLSKIGWGAKIAKVSINNSNTTFQEIINLYKEIVITNENLRTSNNYIMIRDHNYIINEDLTLPAGHKLTIERGVILNFSHGIGLNLYGEMEINGEIFNPVIFMSQNDSYKWRGITIKGGGKKIYGNSFIILNALEGLDLIDGQVTLNNAIISNTKNYAIRARNSSLINLNNVLINSIYGDGLTFESMSNANVEGSIIIGNNIGVGVNINESIVSFKNSVLSNYEYGVKIEGGKEVTIENTLIERVETGIYIHFIDNCYINKNSIQNCRDELIRIYNKSYPVINYNNLLQDVNKDFVTLWGIELTDKALDLSNNYWNTQYLEEAKRRVEDNRIDNNGTLLGNEINIEPIETNIIEDAFPQ